MARKQTKAAPLPDGLGEDNLQRAGLFSHHASPIALLILGAIILVALSGLAGGGPRPVNRIETGAATLVVKAPAVIRTGMLFEVDIEAVPKRGAADLTIGIAPSLFYDMTENTMVPGATDETFDEGFFRYAYGPAEPGKPLRVKMDLQINPSRAGVNKGVIALFDGKRELARLPLQLEVRP